jgi:hypothetical protein
MPDVIDQPKLGKHGGDRRSEKAKADQGGHQNNGSTLKPSQKNTKAHWLLRLERDRPDLAARVCAKEMSANAAAIEAGFRKRPLKGWARSRRIDPASLIG